MTAAHTAGETAMPRSTPIRRRAARALCALLAAAMTFAPVTAAYAAPTPLADIPIAAKVTAKPNIFYTLDDSGSMQYNFLPDYVTNAAAQIPLTNITRAGAVATATLTAANNALLAAGDYVTVSGATPPEFNGYYKIETKPTSTTFTYLLTTLPAGTTSSGTRVLLTSSAYCRQGNTTVACAQQAVNIGQTVVGLSAITRPPPAPPSSVGGSVTATAKWTGTFPSTTYNQVATLQDGDSVLIQNTAAAPIPANSSAPYYGVFTITNVTRTVSGTSATITFDYTITAIGAPAASASQTPLSAAGNRQVVIAGATFAHPPLHAADFNRLAYNPSVTYTAPLKADGLPLTNTGTDSKGNYGFDALKWSAASVDRDPFSAYETLAGVTPMSTAKDTLGAKVNVTLYCNTDWPTLVNEPNGPATALDVGDANGQYRSGAGAWCRINGTKYDVSAASGAPAIEADYNYPWSVSSGATGPQYFTPALANKRLWCDTTSPYYPKNTANIVGCNGGTANYTGPPRTQTCIANGNTCNPDPLLRNFTPPECKTDPSAMYCAPGTGGSGSNTPGTGALPECLACTCNNDTAPATPGRCSINTGVSCSAPFGAGNPACPDLPPITITSCTGGTPIYGNDSGACTKLLFDPYTNAPLIPATTMLDDANGAGIVCRHNNRIYGVMGAPAVSGVATYSRTNTGDVHPLNKQGPTVKTPFGYVLNQTGAFTQGVTTGCPVVGTTVPIPRHYYVIDSVEFCDNRNITANDQWRGFGAGTCVANNDLQRYKEVKYGKFTRVDLFPSNAVAFPGAGSFAASATPYPMGRVWLAGTTPGPDNSESINYANWYAYYSTRLNAAKSTSATAFSYLTNVPPDPIQYRVGFHTLGEEPDGLGGGGTEVIWLDVADWDLTQRTAWYNKLFGVAVNNFKTPTLDAMIRIGDLVENGGTGTLPAEINPLPSPSDPFPDKPSGAPGEKVTCTSNYHILFTDGKTNQVQPVTTIGDLDDTVPATLAAIPQLPPDYMLDTLGPAASTGAAWPAPFKQGVLVSNTLADVATRYWARDLRPTLKNNVPAVPSAKDDTGYSNDGDVYKGDVAWWQHVNFSAISFGAEGTLEASNQKATLDEIIAGTKSWPDLTQPYNPIYPKGAAAGAVAVDDLWHATVMGHGSFVFARSPIEVSYGLASILSGIQNQRKSRSGAAFGGQVLSDTNNIIFEPTIEPGWAGDLLKVEIKPSTGEEVKRWWQASTTLKDQIDPAKTGTYEPWMDPAHRRIVTLTGSTGPGTPFQFASLSAGQLASLSANATEQKKIISYLRGGNTWTDPVTSVQHSIEGTSIGQYRKRFGVLGDLSNAQPVIVFPPSRPYRDETDPGYSAYKTAYTSRSPRVIAAANDGMVHVFDTGPMPQGGTAVTAGGGTEVFAYIPRALFKGAGDASGIQALTYQDGGIPIYKHHMYVDSSPRVADIYDGSAWRTIVVGGLGKGGNGYYALDLTNADAADETEAAAKVMWEWSDPEVKYSYGRPLILKVRDSAYPYGRWVVVVTGGYDNVSGKGKIFFLDAVTGTLLSTVTTSAGSPPGAGQASGLAQIHAFVRQQNNQIAEQIYGGDLLGNVWRVDVSAPGSYKTAPAVLFATLDDGSVAQAVTTAPQIEIDINNGVDRYVFVGTGRLLDTSDFTASWASQKQTMYAIRDGTIDAFSTSVPVNARTFTKPINADGISAIAGGAPNGWHHDLPNIAPNAERIVVDPTAAVNIAAYVGTRVQDDPCVIALPASLYGRDYTTGESLLQDDSENIVSYIDFQDGLVGVDIRGMKQDDGSQLIGIVASKEIPGAKPVKVVNKFKGIGNRISWRLLGGQ
jgi:type IV pilus assembly protein PilY1